MTPREPPVSVLAVAIGGYGFHYLQALFNERARSWRLAGVVDPAYREAGIWRELQARGVAGYETIEAFYEGGGRADLAIIASPIHAHVPQSVTALEHGADVLCEKPMAATVDEAYDLMSARDRAGRWVLIGYQWSFSRAILALKRDMRRGLYGAPRRARALCFWPRDFSYYSRNAWAGRLRDVETGCPVRDSPANNAMAHHLHNLFFLLGPHPDRSARPCRVQAEIYRAYDIENADTCALRAETAEGVEVLFYASHVTRRAVDPVFTVVFDDAVVSYEGREAGIVAVDRRGRRTTYGAPDDTAQFHKLRVALRRAGKSAVGVCGPEAALAQTLCIDAMHRSCSRAARFPDDLVRTDARANRRWVSGLEGVLLECYRRAALPGERRVRWAETGKTVEV